jgi:hypothetical protein
MIHKKLLQHQREMRQKIKDATDAIKAQANIEMATMIAERIERIDNKDEFLDLLDKDIELSCIYSSSAFKVLDNNSKDVLNASRAMVSHKLNKLTN